MNAYTFDVKKTTETVGRGIDRYGSKVANNDKTCCPVCEGVGACGMLKCHHCAGIGYVKSNSCVVIKTKAGERFPYKAYDTKGVLLYEGSDLEFTKMRGEQELESDWYKKQKRGR